MLSLRFVLLTLFSVLSCAAYGTGNHPPAGHHHEHAPTVRLSENKGQWPAAVRFRTRLPSADVWLENDGMRCMLYEPNIGERTHPLPAGEAPDYVKAHAYDLRWVDANPNVRPVAFQAYPDPEHYFIGDDPAQWASDVRAYKKVLYPEIWPGINLSMYGEGRSLKYDFYLNPGADPRSIRMRYSGLERLVVRDDRLELRTSVQAVEEQMPIAYQDLPGSRQRVACQYIALDDSTVGFLFPDGYNPRYPVVIDPVLIFSTYTGSTSDNWGFTATYDEAGNLYSGGIVNGGGYPASTGAYQLTYSGGYGGGGGGLNYSCDMGLIKYSADGTQRLWATYVGGRHNEQPHSLVVNANNELFVLGSTRSNNFPTTPGALQTTLAGTYVTNATGDADIVVLRISATGAALQASTYVGGTGVDGLNLFENPNILYFFYADDARGEILLDGQSCIIASCTRSNNFPTTPGAFQTTFGGTQDACLFRLNASMSALEYSTYFGGTSYDAGYGVKIATDGSLYMVGGTISNNLPTTAGVLNPAYQGGSADGFVFQFEANASAVRRGTYIGTNQYDQVYLIDLDARDNVYVAGQTTGAYPILNAPYNVAGGKQFITCLTSNLSQTRFSTRFGTGLAARTRPDITLTALLVDRCDNIYVAGWGAAGTGFRVRGENSGNTSNMPITADAYQSTTEGSDFYLMALYPDAGGLQYATFFGGPQSGDHVDGGTSRFDKRGVVYHSTCASCGTGSDFPTTAGAWSQINGSGNCNNASFKFNFDLLPELDARYTFDITTSSGCAPYTVQFTNGSTGTSVFYWDFGDGNHSTEANPTYTYNNPGEYTVRLVGIDANVCGLRDTVEQTIIVYARTTPDVTLTTVPCELGVTVTNNTVDGTTHHWDFGDGFESDLEHPAPHTYLAPGTYTVRYTVNPNSSCAEVWQQQITVGRRPVAGFTINYAGCTGAISFTNTSQTVDSGEYSWNFGDSNTSTAFQPTHTYTAAGNYDIRLIADPNGPCPDTLIRPVSIVLPPIAGAVSSNQTICRNRTPNLLTLSGHYQNIDRWEQSFDGVTWTTLSNTQATFQPPALTTTRHYRAIVSTPGCTPVASTPAIVTVNQTTVGFTINYAGCTGAISFTNTSQNVAGGSYSWNFGDGGTSTAFQPTHTYTVAGNYNIRLIADPNGQCPDTLIRPVSIVLPPIAGAVSSNQTICRNRTPNLLTLSGHYQNIDRWEQSFDGITWTTLSNTQATFQPPALTTTRHYRAIVSTPGCTPVASTPAVVTVDQTTVGFTVNYAGCTGAISFTNTSQNVAGGSYSWNFGDGGTSTAFQPTHTYTVAGNFNIRLIADPNGQCPDTLIRPVSIILPPIAGAVSSNQTICRNEQPNQLLLSGQYGTIDRWEESLDGVNWTPIANTQPWYLPPTLTTTRNYRAILSTPGCAAVQSTPARITVDQTTADFAINYAGCTPDISFTNLSQNVVGGYLWSFGDGNTSTAFQPTHSYVSMGTYNIRLIAHPSGQCPDTMIRPVTIRFLPIGGTLSSDRTVCQGSPAGTLSLSGQRGDVARWESSTDGATWTSIAHFGASYFVGSLSQTTWFRVVMTVEGCGIDPSTIARVQVDAPTIPGTLPNQVARCDGETTIRIDLTGHQGQILRWERRQTCDFGSWLPIASTDDFLLIEPFDGTACYRAVVKNGVCPEGPSSVARITNSTVIRSQLNYVDHVRCNGDGTGAIAHHVSGGMPPYTYLWSTGHTVEDIDGIDGGTHTVTVTDANGCTAVFSFTVYEPDSLDIVLNSLTPIRCNKGREGSIGVDVRGGTGPYSYFWNSAANDLQSTQENIDKLPAGVYRITVTDFNNCVATRTYTLTDPAPVQVTVTQAPSGSCDYMLTASVTGAQGSLASITWSNGETTLRSSGWKPGDTWSVFIIDGNGCAGAAFGKVSGPGPIRVDTSYIQHESCFGKNDGAVGLVVLGGTPGYTFAWEELTRGLVATTEDLISQPAGSYALTITDVAGCSKVHYIDIQGPKEALQATPASLRHVSCAGRADGDAALVVSGGTPPYSVVWNDGAQGLFRNNLAGGFYSAEVTDVNGCRVSVGLTIEEPEPLRAAQTFIRHPECKGFATGSLSYDISGGKQDYDFLWSTGSTDENLTGLTAGVYSLTVTDAAGCTLVKRDTLTEPTALVISANTIAPPRCHDSSDGAILVNVNGGVFPYQYAWTNGQNSQHATGLPSGSYTVYVTDANGCQAEATYSLTAPPPLSIKLMAIRQPSCAGSTDGLIYVAGQGGANGYRYSWFKGQQFLRTGPIAYGLSAGGYRVEVVDFFGCTISQGFTLTEPAPLSLTIESQNPTCSQAGQLSAITSGGTAPYTWLWSDNSTGNRLSIADGGPYNVSVRDANGCVVSASVNVPNIPTLSLSVVSTKNIACRNGNDGVFEVAAASGKAPYTYKWSDNATGARRTGLTAGWYSVTATDAEGCVGQLKDLQLTEPANGVTLQIDYVVPERCFGSRTGAIGIDTKGGTKPYTYAWSHGSVREDASRLRKGTYTLTATDSKGCRSVLSVNVPGPDLPLTINAPVVQPERCNGRRDGLIVLDVRGGQGPYKYAWSQGGAGQAAVGLGAGTYSVIVTDAFGCTATRSFTLTSPPPLTLEFVNVQQPGCDDRGRIEAKPSGGTGPYTYQWTNGGLQYMIDNLSAGAYSVIVRDAKGCTVTGTVTLTASPPLYAKVVSFKDARCGGAKNGSIGVDVWGGVQPYTYRWSHGPTVEDVSNLGAGLYTLDVTDAAGCVVSLSQVISEPPRLVVSPGAVVAPRCATSPTGAIGTNVVGGTQPYTYRWNHGPTTQDIRDLVAGTYGLLVRDSKGCFATLRVDLTAAPCDGDDDGGGEPGSTREAAAREASGWQLAVYPNPAQDFIRLEVRGEGPQELPFTAYDLTGRRMLTGRMQNAAAVVDVRAWSAGVYVFRIETAPGVYESLQVLVGR